jgi:uridine kinase
MPCVDLLTDQVDLLTTNFGEVDMLILDGLYAIKTEGVDLKIFIDIPYDESGKAKDLRGKEPNNEFRNQVLHQEHKMVSELKSMADVVVTKDYSIEVV